MCFWRCCCCTLRAKPLPTGPEGFKEKGEIGKNERSRKLGELCRPPRKPNKRKCTQYPEYPNEKREYEEKKESESVSKAEMRRRRRMHQDRRPVYLRPVRRKRRFPEVHRKTQLISQARSEAPCLHNQLKKRRTLVELAAKSDH